MWKILTTNVPNDLNITFYMNERSAIKAKLPDIPAHRANITLNDKSFFVLGPKLWNILPPACSLTLHSLESFKQSLQDFIQQYPDLPPTDGYPSSNSNQG